MEGFPGLFHQVRPGCKGRNLCSDRSFHHQHLRELYKLILASLVEKSIKILPGIHVWGIVQSAYTNALVPCNDDAHTFLFFVGES